MEIQYFKYNIPFDAVDAEAVLSDMAEALVVKFPELAAGLRTGIYMCSPDSGAYDAIVLWKNALEHGPDFANPKNFPWTLACCPSSYFARNWGAQGPNVTLVGGIDTFEELQPLLQAHSKQNAIEVAVLCYLQWNSESTSQENGVCKGAILRVTDLFIQHLIEASTTIKTL